MGKEETNKKNTVKKHDIVNKTPVAPETDSTAKKTNASVQQPAKNSAKIDSKQNNIQKDQLKSSGMTLRSHRKFLEKYTGMQLRSHPKIEFKHLD